MTKTFRLKILLLIFASTLCKGEDVFYNVNNKKILHKVSDKFLSISIDPAVLLAGVNLSDISLTLGKNLSPAYIRLAGPSTPFVKYLDNEEEQFSHAQRDNVYITPAMWFGINEWLNLADLTPIFGLNDKETEKGVWNPEPTMPLLEMSDKFGVACYWQLGFGCSNKTAVQYVEDLNILKQTLKGFPEHSESWKIVGSDLSTCNAVNVNGASFEHVLRDLDQTVDAVVWDSAVISKRGLGLTQAALWTSIPKESQPVTFASAIDWAIKVGRVATLEYSVIFREPRLLEITHDTPVYWFSFLYKRLMGSNVLEIKSTNLYSTLPAFAHCTKRQNNFVRSGAITIMVINNGSESSSANVRLGSFLLERSMEIQSYFMTESNISTSEIFLNDRPVTMDMLNRAEEILKPKLRRAKIRPHISLEIPQRTIAFFVLTGAKYSLCTNNEEDLASILKEINEDQGASMSAEETRFTIEQRLLENENEDSKFPFEQKVTLENIKRNILKEMELDKSYYNKEFKIPHVTNQIVVKSNQDQDHKRDMLHNHLRAFIEKSKRNELQTDLKYKKEKQSPHLPAIKNLQLTVQEIEDILKRRAKAKAAERNIKLTSSELDVLVNKATLKIPKHVISKRDINRLLLEEKANFYKNNLFSQEMYEQLEREKKLFPKYNNRLKRSVNTALLNLKATMEQNKKYIPDPNGHLRKSPAKSLSKSKRDINLDLLRKRTQPMSAFGKEKVIVQPNYLKHQKSIFGENGKDHFDPLSLNGKSSDDLFEDIMRFEERAFEDLALPKDTFTEVDNLDLDKLEEDFFRKIKNQQASSLLRPHYNIESIKLPKSRSKPESLIPDDYLQFLKAPSEQFGRFGEDDDESCEDQFGFSKYGKLKSGRKGNGKKEQSLCADIGDLNFSSDMGYGLLRKKRDLNIRTKEKLRALKKDVKNEVKKLRQTLREDKTRYIKEKIKSKADKNKKRARKNKSNVQYVPRNELLDVKSILKNATINEIIAQAASKENMVVPPLEHRIQKRAFMNNDINQIFGQYRPITSGLRAWKPSDILNLHKNYFTTLPVYSWIQDQNLRNAILKNLNTFGLRRKRYIEGNSLNLENNDIDDDDRSFAKYDEHIKDYDARKGPKLESTTYKVVEQKVVTTDRTNKVNAEKISLEKLSYLEKALGKKKVKPIEDFFKDVGDKFNKMTKSIKDFFVNLF